MVIDFHTHVFPDKIAESTITKLAAQGDMVAFTNGSVSQLKQSMKESGIDLSVVLPVVTNPVKTNKINDNAIKITEENEGILSFGGIHPDTINHRAVLADIKKRGFKGIKIHPEYQHTNFDDIRYLRILECAEELELVTVVHAGFDGGFPKSERCQVRHILNVLDNVKPKKMVLAHMGGFNIWSYVKKYIAGSDVYFDTGLSFGKKPGIFCLLSEPDFVELSRAHGVDKILFGTDSPWGEQKEMKEFVENSSMTKEEKEKVLYKNAVKLLNLKI